MYFSLAFLLSSVMAIQAVTMSSVPIDSAGGSDKHTPSIYAAVAPSLPGRAERRVRGPRFKRRSSGIEHQSDPEGPHFFLVLVPDSQDAKEDTLISRRQILLSYLSLHQRHHCISSQKCLLATHS
ncbi:hypothetical protein KEM48_000028 [Puccinia striiformis f. sp. tritici PST-130]|nr:hypothetical protein KEM48_000028 [Puccinia striiformis f. sp. tritici PST-130]